ncbi:hypothetical protein GUJ93_ZPchr0013g34751 [Zizania palustris]|uniref:Uncharacterized protein n=1 Tax=Zizania palustris TaxID=103762 RepID=A0A8J5WXB7_ZIZPA|nr:hypothetical protein GUJ93_ZPchr0013g34751 [Zizania palustris]
MGEMLLHAPRRSSLLLAVCWCSRLLLLFPVPASAMPLCTDSRAPVPMNGTMGFCGGGGGGGSTCCGASADAALRKQFEAMNVSDAACAGVVKSVLCAAP